MTEFITRNYGQKEFEVIIKTDSQEHYKKAEDFARRLIDHAKPQTNADRIRARLEKDEELADLRICYNPDTDMYDTDAGSFTDFVSAMEAELEWLRQPAKEDENE